MEINKKYALAALALCIGSLMPDMSGSVSAREKKINPPVMGWSSWNAFRVNISDSIICRYADLLVQKGLKDVGYRYVNIDDGFFGKRDSAGYMHVHARRFPNGLRPVAEHIHRLGLKAGIYSDAGNHTCGSMWDNDSAGLGAGLYGHEAQDADLYFKKCGFDFIKIDYCGAEQLGLIEKDQYTNIYNHIRKVKKGVSINICRWAFPGTWAKDVATSWRIGKDISADWNSVKTIVADNLYLSAYAGNGHYNDMDMMVVGFRDAPGPHGKGLTLNEEEAHFGMWCIMSSPLLIGCKLDKLSEASLAILKNRELIAINQDPLGLQAYVVKRQGDGYVLAKDIETKHGLRRAVAFYNPSEQPITFDVSLAELELGGDVQVRDLIRQKDLGTYRDKLKKEVAPHSALVMKMEAARRLEADRYEAEWAYLPMFDAIGRNKITYVPDKEASGGMKVSYLGGMPGNYAEWKEVYSQKGGLYDMTISYANGQGRELEITVNGERQMLKSLADDKGFHQICVPVRLKRGYNDIRLGNSYNWAPDIDCFTLNKK